jgi:flagellum-specific ATP synthase
MTIKAPKSLRLKKISRANLTANFKNIDWDASGKVCNVIGQAIEAYLPSGKLGNVVSIDVPQQNHGTNDGKVLAEVVGFKNERAVLLPYSNISGISPGNSVSSCQSFANIPVGDFLLGRVIDPMMKTSKGPPLVIPERPEMVPIDREAPNPLERKRIAHPLSLGIRAIDSFLTFGEGQRIGIMAGSGVGKSVLMGMIARGSEADINVIGLIGERGREVREFIENNLGAEGLARSVVVCVTSDQSPLMRIRGAKVVTAIAEHFSDKGKRVLVMMDSLTRVAMAQREVGLAVGEPPTTKGYPPSVFSLLPRLLERCGPQPVGNGSISGLFTVLVDGDDFNDPIPDAARAILDGHINLSRRLASKNHYPAIEVSSSVSRVMQEVADEEHLELASMIRTLIGTYEEKADLIQIGGYQQGMNPTLDQAVMLMPAIDSFLKQATKDQTNLEEAKEGMRAILQGRLAAQQAPMPSEISL